MAVIIGFGTTVGGAFAGACATSVNWGYNPNIQRLYCLGDISPWRNVEKPTETISVTVYQESGGPSSHNVTASTSCDDLSALSASVSPGGCGVVPAGVSGDFYLTNYSYSKGDPNMPGQETWALTRWRAGISSPITPAPNHYIRAASEGQSTEQDGSTGITFTGNILTGTTGSVSAGGMGGADTIYFGTVINVGGATLMAGEVGNGSASTPVTPLWTD